MTLDGTGTLLEENLLLFNETLNGIHPSMEDNLQWETPFIGWQ